MDATKYTGRAIKRRLFDLLNADDFDQKLDELRGLPGRRAVNLLFSFLCHHDQKIKWRAVTAMGMVISNLAEKKPRFGVVECSVLGVCFFVRCWTFDVRCSFFFSPSWAKTT